MQVKTITVNAAGTVAERGVQGIGLSGASQAQTEDKDIFGAECRVTISQKGKDLSRQQASQKEAGVLGGQNLREERKLLHQQEQAELSKEIRDGYREELAAIDKQIAEYNKSVGRINMRTVNHDRSLMDKTIEEEVKLRTSIQNQKAAQSEENQKRAREAQQMAMQSAQYQEEVDENNRELLTILKTMEETEKAEEEAGEGADRAVDGGASDTKTSVADVIKGSAAQFVSSSMRREMGVEDGIAKLEESGRWYVDAADSMTKNVLQRTAGIRAALDDESFTDEQIAEMMQELREEMPDIYKNVKDFREFGIRVLGLGNENSYSVRDAKLEHIAADPLQGVQETKDSMMLSAVDAVIGEERQGALNQASQELADEVEELIDERNKVDKAPEEQEEEKAEEAQAEKAEDLKDKAEKAQTEEAESLEDKAEEVQIQVQTAESLREQAQKAEDRSFRI